MDFRETFTINSLLKKDELIRFSRSWGQRSRSFGVNLDNPVGPISPERILYETFTIDSLPKEEEQVMYSRSWGQRSRSYGVDLEILVGAISTEPLNGFS